MSKTYQLRTTDGVDVQTSSKPKAMQHAIAFRVEGTNPQGTVSVKARYPGSDVFEEVPGATGIDLASPTTTQFVGPVKQYEVTLTGVSGVVSLSMTDTTGDYYAV